MLDDPYAHKEVVLRVGDRRLALTTSQELFSAHAVDTGTIALVRSLRSASIPPPTRVLDLGCGYGPVGLAAKETWPGAAVTVADRDALAVDYAAANAGANGLEVEAVGSVGYDEVGTGPDLVVSNVPGKAPDLVHRELLVAPLGAARTAAVVVVEPLVGRVDELLAGAGATVALRELGARHAVFHYHLPPGEAPGATAVDRGVYDRAVVPLALPSGTVEVRTVHGVREFDQLGYDTELGLELLAGIAASDVLLTNPGQGHLGAALALGAGPASMLVVDRDLLALRATARNLAALGAAPTPAVRHATSLGVVPAIDLAVLPLRPKEPRPVLVAALAGAAAALRPGGRVIVLGRAAAVRRLLVNLDLGTLALRRGRERRARGHAALELLARSRA
ncbi:MAG: methyltransferase [Acidimicrobiia bacterium]